MVIKSRKDTKVCGNMMEYYIMDKRNKLDLTIGMEKFWKYYWMKKDVAEWYIAWATFINLENTQSHIICNSQILIHGLKVLKT